MSSAEHQIHMPRNTHKTKPHTNIDKHIKKRLKRRKNINIQKNIDTQKLTNIYLLSLITSHTHTHTHTHTHSCRATHLNKKTRKKIKRKIR